MAEIEGPVAFRFRKGDGHDWHYEDAGALPKRDRELLRSKGWTVEPLYAEVDE